MVIYEVNLRVKKHIETEFLAWLKTHIDEMLTLPGFSRATVYTRSAQEENSEPALLITVHYNLSSRDDLENYFAKDALRMRQQGKNRFAGNFTADRRILYYESVSEIVSKN